MINNTATQRLHRRARVDRYSTFDTRTYQRFFRAQAGNRLALHVGTHQGTVCIVVFKEWNKRCGNRYDLGRRNVHIVNVIRRGQHGFTGLTASNQIAYETTLLIELGVCLCNHETAFFNRRQVIDLIAHTAIDNLAIGRFQETILVQTSV